MSDVADETEAGLLPGTVDDNADSADETVTLYNQQEGLMGRPPGIYLDEVEAKQQEDYAAMKEGREPNYETMGAGAGRPLVPVQMLAPTTPNTVSHLTDDFNVDEDGNLKIGATPFTTVTVPKDGDDEVEDTGVADQIHAEDEVRGTDTPVTTDSTSDMTTEQDQLNADQSAKDGSTPTFITPYDIAHMTPEQINGPTDPIPAEIVPDTPAPAPVVVPPVDPAESNGS